MLSKLFTAIIMRITSGYKTLTLWGYVVHSDERLHNEIDCRISRWYVSRYFENWNKARGENFKGIQSDRERDESTDPVAVESGPSVTVHLLVDPNSEAQLWRTMKTWERCAALSVQPQHLERRNQKALNQRREINQEWTQAREVLPDDLCAH